MKSSDKYYKAYDEAFSNAKLLTSKGFETWVDLEIIFDTLAGPLYNVQQYCSIEYVYEDTENRFIGVHNWTTFRDWATKLTDKYRNTVLSFAPSNEDEEHDKKVLLARSDAMKNVIELSKEEIDGIKCS